MRRGEIWVGAGGGYASKPRPLLIVQDDRFDGTDSVAVCLMTSTEAAMPLLRVAVPADEVSGLDIPSWVMVDKIITLRRPQVTRHVGRLTASQLVDVERLMMVFLGLAQVRK
jgi:mRNA interferase MazF